MMTFGEVAAWYRAQADALEGRLEEVVVQVIGQSVVRAKAYIGHQQDSWPALHEATIEGFRHDYGFWIPGKRELGYSGPDFEPLHRTGQLEESISGTTDGLMGIVGSDDKVALYQEMGTPNARYPIPPRPFLALALMEAGPQIVELCGEVGVLVLLPQV